MNSFEQYKEAAESKMQQLDYAEAEANWSAALQIAQYFGKQDTRYSYCLDSLAKVQACQQKYREAEHTYKQSIKIKEVVYGESTMEVAKTINLLAALYYEQKNYSLAQPLGERVLSIYKSILGPQHPAVATMANNLSRVYRKLGKFVEADELHKKAEEVKTKAAAQPEPEELKHSKKRISSLESICDICNKEYTGPACMSCTQAGIQPFDMSEALRPTRRQE